jgi:phosphoglucomutase
MSGVVGPYAKAIFHTLLGVPLADLLNCEPSEDFNGGHPDPNLTYAPELVERMGLLRDGTVNPAKSGPVPDFGAAADGDADRNMILGRRFYVTPSDSLAVLAANVAQSVPYFSEGLKCIARSMPTSAAADLVAAKLNVPIFEVPTGWKFFVNLCDQPQYNPLICGEESFGTGSSHIREKDGIFAVLCWLSVLAKANADASKPLVSVADIVQAHWAVYGRNHYQRYDYEDLPVEVAAKLTAHLTAQLTTPQVGGGFTVRLADEFSYSDSVDKSVSANQGWRYLLTDGSRFVFRLSGTGSSGATVRLYLEKYTPPSEGADKLHEAPGVALQSLVRAALAFAQVKEILQRPEPTVIT